MKKRRSIWSFLTLANAISILLFGCSLYVSGVETARPTTDLNASETAFNVIATSTETTMAPTTVVTSTSVATLSPNNALNKLLELYDNNGGCKIPCWWTITPGVTTWNEAYEQLAPLGYVAPPIIHGDITRYEFEFAVPAELSSLGYFWPKISVKNDIVTSISINSSYIERDFDFSLAGLLKTFGAPEEIWIKPTVESMTDVPFYEIRLFYPSKGTLISANKDAEIKDNNFIICPIEFKIDNFPPSIVFWSAQQSVEFSDFGLSVLGNLTWDTRGYYQLKELTTEFDEKDFYDTYLNPTTEVCFSFAINKLR